jgi:glycosyltransferase involved in cell wall biosynthesis
MISVTIVVPIYNKEDYIIKLVETIKSQSIQPNEVIFIDDASTDYSLKILKSLDLDEKFKIIENSINLGVSQSRNLGISLSKNDIVCLLDSDDYLDADYLISMYKTMTELNCNLLGSSYSFDINGKIKHARTVSCDVDDVRKVSLKDFYRSSLFHNLPFTCSSVFLNKDKFLSLGGFPVGISMGEDQVLWTKFLTEGKCYFMNKSKAYYRLNVANSACSNNLSSGWLDYLPLLKNEQSIFYDLYIFKLISYYMLFVSNKSKSDYKQVVRLIKRWYLRAPLGVLIQTSKILTKVKN